MIPESWFIVECKNSGPSAKGVSHYGSSFHVQATFELAKIIVSAVIEHILNIPAIVEKVQEIQCLPNIKTSLLNLTMQHAI